MNLPKLTSLSCLAAVLMLPVLSAGAQSSTTTTTSTSPAGGATTQTTDTTTAPMTKSEKKAQKKTQKHGRKGGEPEGQSCQGFGKRTEGRGEPAEARRYGHPRARSRTTALRIGQPAHAGRQEQSWWPFLFEPTHPLPLSWPRFPYIHRFFISSSPVCPLCLCVPITL